MCLYICMGRAAHCSRTQFYVFSKSKKRDFLRFLSVISKKRKKVESLIQVSCTQIRLPVSDDYKTGYFPKCRLLGAL